MWGKFPLFPLDNLEWIVRHKEQQSLKVKTYKSNFSEDSSHKLTQNWETYAGFSY